jgi:hypothetical protein
MLHLLDVSMVDVRCRGALGFYFGEAMYAQVTSSAIIQALELLSKKSNLPPPQEIGYPVFSKGAKECPSLSIKV